MKVSVKKDGPFQLLVDVDYGDGVVLEFVWTRAHGWEFWQTRIGTRGYSHHDDRMAGQPVSDGVLKNLLNEWTGKQRREIEEAEVAA